VPNAQLAAGLQVTAFDVHFIKRNNILGKACTVSGENLSLGILCPFFLAIDMTASYVESLEKSRIGLKVLENCRKFVMSE